MGEDWFGPRFTPNRRFERIAEGAADRTNAELAEAVTRLVSLDEREVSRLLPTRKDKEQLAKLMAIVRSREPMNQKVALLKRNIEELAPTIKKRLRRPV